MTHIAGSKLLSLHEATCSLPGRRQPATTRQVYRWIRSGVRGVRLRATSIGHVLFTTRLWVDEFLDLLEQLAQGYDDAEAILREAGL